MGNIITKIVVWLLRNSRLTIENRITLTNEILDKLHALPFCDIITNEIGSTLEINGRPATIEDVRLLREGAKTALYNPTLKLIREQVAFIAVNIGIHKAQNNDHLYFAKSALWYHQQLEIKLKELAGIETEELNP